MSGLVVCALWILRNPHSPSGDGPGRRARARRFRPGRDAGDQGTRRADRGLCAMAGLETGPFATRTRARYALFLELAGHPQLGDPLRRQRREFERWTERMVIALGIA